MSATPLPLTRQPLGRDAPSRHPLTRRQFLAALGVTAAGAALTGCGSATPQASTGPVLDGAYTGPPVTLEYWNGFTGGDGPAMRQIVADFNASQDLITVRMNVVQWGQYYQRVIAAVHAGKGPDVGAMHIDQLATQAARQTITPIDDVVTELDLSAEQYPSEVWEAGNYNGNRYGIPLDVHSLGSYANMALLQRAGIDAQATTGEELETQNAALLEAGVESPPFWMPNRWPAHLMFLSLLWQFGGEPYAEDGTEATFDSDAGVQALSWMVSQVEKGFSPPNVAPDSQYTAFKNNEVAYTWDGIWQINDLQAVPDLDWSLAPVPTIGPEPAVWASSHQFVMFKSRQPDDDRLMATKSFLQFMTENSAAWAAAGMIPARSEARETPEFRDSPQAAVAEAIPAMRFLPPVAALGEVQAQTLETAVSDAILGRAEPAAALQAAASQASALMQGNLRKFER